MPLYAEFYLFFIFLIEIRVQNIARKKTVALLAFKTVMISRRGIEGEVIEILPEKS